MEEVAKLIDEAAFRQIDFHRKRGTTTMNTTMIKRWNDALAAADRLNKAGLLAKPFPSLSNSV